MDLSTSSGLIDSGASCDGAGGVDVRAGTTGIELFCAVSNGTNRQSVRESAVQIETIDSQITSDVPVVVETAALHCSSQS